MDDICRTQPRKTLTPLTHEDIRRVQLEGGIEARHECFQTISRDKDDFAALVEAGMQMLRKYRLDGWISETFYEIFLQQRGKYIEECEDLATLAGVDKAALCLLQRLYSWSKFSTTATPDVLGCSAACFHHPTQGMYLTRCLDWSKPEGVLGNATRIVEYQRHGVTAYKAVQVLGMTGHLSILKPGKFAVVINWAPEHGLPGFGLDPTHRLREITEDPSIDSYDKVIAALTSPNHDIGADAFFTVAGIERDEMYVVERKGSSNKYWIRRPAADESRLVQTNHYDAQGAIGTHLHVEPTLPLPEGEDGYCLSTAQTTWVRQRALQDALAVIAEEAEIWNALHDCLNIIPVLNNDTRQQMVMHVASGEIRAWRETTGS